MDKAATQGAFQLTRTSDGAPVSGSFGWYGSGALIFKPDADLAPGMQYTGQRLDRRQGPARQRARRIRSHLELYDGSLRVGLELARRLGSRQPRARATRRPRCRRVQRRMALRGRGRNPVPGGAGPSPEAPPFGGQDLQLALFVTGAQPGGFSFQGGGTIRLVKNGVTQAAPFLDISSDAIMQRLRPLLDGAGAPRGPAASSTSSTHGHRRAARRSTCASRNSAASPAHLSPNGQRIVDSARENRTGP